MNRKRVVLSLLMLCCFTVAWAAGKHRYTLVIDAGHGGKDAGACAFGAKEKTINLNVALAFGRYVENNCPDVQVIYTRKTDIFVPLHKRAAIANRNKADVFISIHTNAVASKRPITGMETYTMGIRRSNEKLSAAIRENEVISYEKDYKQRYAGYDPRSPESMMVFSIMNEQNMAKSVELASLIQKYTCSTAGRPNKGVRQDAFLVLRETSMPACLIELGYITTRSDKNYLVNKRNVDRMGRGIYQAFVAFMNKETGRAVAPLNVHSLENEQDEPEESVPARKKTNTRTASRNETARGAQGAPVFKVQLLTTNRKLKKNDARLKGVRNADYFKENGLLKYTVGSSENYNEIYRLRKSLLKKFPQAFIIAFRNGEKIDAGEAYQEYKRRKK